MKGPPGNGKAQSIDDDDEARKFAELQQRALARGYTLRSARSGFILQRGTHSVHTADLKLVAYRMKAREPAR